MTHNKKEKSHLHPRNQHSKGYDFDVLIKVFPELKQHVFINKYDKRTINFFEPKAILALNKALLFNYYGVSFWEVPEGYLCPPIPGRVDYIHYLADLIDQKLGASILDIGTGANCIYPLLGHSIYGWKFKASEVDEIAIENARLIVGKNGYQDTIKIVRQNNTKEMFYGVINPEDYFEVSLCNPPFFKSQLDAEKANKRKVKNLSKNKHQKPTKNFGGQNNELWYKGGEKAFIKKMIKESSKFKDKVNWFTTLVSNHKNLKSFEQAASNVNVKSYKVIPMKHGQKTSHIFAWQY